MTLADFTTTDVLTAAPETPVADVAAAFREHDEAVVAVLREGRPLGLVSVADLGRAYVAGVSLADEPVESLLSGDPVTIQSSATRAALVSLFEAADARRVIVVDHAGDFVGVATFDAVLASFARELVSILDILDD